MRHQHPGDNDCDSQEPQVNNVLSSIRDGPLRQDFLQFSRGHKAAGKRQRTEDNFQRKHAHHETRHVRRAQIKFGGANQGHTQRAKCVAESGPLRHCGHGHFAKRHTDDRSQHQSDHDPFVFDDAAMQ